MKKRFTTLCLAICCMMMAVGTAWAQTPTPTRILDDIPVNWTVTADGNTVTVTPYYSGSPLGSAVVPEGATVVLTPPDPDKPRVKNVSLLDSLNTPLTFEAKEANSTVTFTKGATLTLTNLEYRVNGGNWTEYTSGTAIPLPNAGDKVSFRGTNAAYATMDNYSYSNFSCSGKCYLYGNVMSLINKDHFAVITELTGNYAFYRLFHENTAVYSHSTKALLMPATTLSQQCYNEMFSGCSNLTTPPALPATTLAEACYKLMFCNCSNLESAPELPATTLASNCYNGMFNGCVRLATAPALPATTLASSCYGSMFLGCTGLTAAPALPATTLAYGCYQSMFYGCDGLTSSPALPAPTLTENCYNWMFNNCSHLNKVICLATDISAPNCTLEWLDGVASSGTFIKPASVTSWLIDNSSGIPYGWTPTIYEPQPLTFEAMTAGATVTFTKATSLPSNSDLEYNVYNDNGWQGWQQYTTGTAITLNNVGHKVSFRGKNNTYATQELYGNYCSRFSCSADCYVYGNIMSLVDSTNFATNTTLPSTGFTFVYMFENNAKIHNNHATKTLVLPATTLAQRCYYGMFKGCTHLTTAPALPATTLADLCYTSMFKGCNNLTIAPVLPAKTLKYGCYSDMFYGCTSLEAVLELPATTLAIYCYNQMFSGCTSLTTVPALPATTLTETCYRCMFTGCTSLTTAPALPATTLAKECYQGMFSGCTILTTAPALPAETLAPYCYQGMFGNCTSMETAPALPATTLANNCYSSMFYKCTSLTTAPALPATTLANYCYYDMFYKCTGLTTAPALPATTLANYCYYEMFYDCTNLNSVTCLATNISASNCTTDWLKNVAATGTFVKPESMTAWPTNNVNGIPPGWTPTVYETQPLTFEAMTAGATVTFTSASTLPNLSVEYSKNGGEWTTYESAVTLDNVGDRVSFRGDNATYYDNSNYISSHFSCSADCYIYGNVMSLISKEGYATATTLTGGRVFLSLFEGNANIHNHTSKTLVLPATTLTAYCYYSMFKGCTGLTMAPALPAEVLAESCYAKMFEGCTSLTTAPNLLAKTLAEGCYYSMFHGCTGLHTVPSSLPATTLQISCYFDMFNGCTSLNATPSLPATTMVNSCYRGMFSGCTSLATAPTLPATTLATACYDYMFSDCTSLTVAPSLPATTMKTSCYQEMFSGCTSLTTAPALPATTLAADCYSSMFSGCKNLTTAPILPAETLNYTCSNCYSHMFDSCTNLSSVTCLATNISGDIFTTDWLKNVAATGTFYKPVSMNSWTLNSPDGIPQGWTAKPSETFQPLTFEAKEANATVTFTINANAATNGVEYSTDGTTWNTYTSGSPISLTKAGDKVSFRGNNSRYATYFFTGDFSYFSCSAECNVYGNIMSLIDATNFATITSLPNSYTFTELFNENDQISNHDTKVLVLPATTLAESCYYGMFNGCTRLTTAPALPATNLANNCYQNMFLGCIELTTAPMLPATTLASYCYTNMFYGCTSLTTVPALPATTLAEACYYSMFHGCSQLNSITCLATDISASSCTGDWLYGVAATGTFNKASGIAVGEGGWALNSASGIPVGWTMVNEGALSGEFTVNAGGGKVNFSMGNLQYTKSSNTWSFMGNQYRTVETNGSPYCTDNYGDKDVVSLFGWGTSGYNHGAICYQPYSTKQSINNYFAYGNISHNLYDQTGQADWGYNAISNGGNTTNQWRTLTKDEWKYLFDNHTKGWATVNGVGGYVIRPDGVTTAVSSSYTASAWATEEAAGSLFLPAAGYRNKNNYGTYVYQVNSFGRYWSSSHFNSATAYSADFTNSNVQIDSGMMYRYYGHSVRLVKNITGQGSIGYATPSVEKMSNEPAFTIPLTLVGDGTVTYSKSGDNNNICTVDENTGEVTLTGQTGPCIITATVADSPFFTYATNTASYTLTVKTPEQIPLTFEAKEANATVTFTKGSNVTLANPLEYSVNGGNWTECTSGTAIPLQNVGDKVSFRGNNATYATNIGNGSYSYFSCTGGCYVYGNVMSLIDADNYPSMTELTNDNNYAFCGLFRSSNSSNSKIYNLSTKALLLPATTLSPYCYAYMFMNCGNLTTSPALPATTLATSCYNSMLSGCNALTTAPMLPATTLADGCYSSMFSGCNALTTAPTLPATTLAESCYSSMFSSCNALTTAPTLPATTLAKSCYNNMFAGCSSLITAPTLPATTLVENCYFQMFYSCTSLTTVPALPATTLAKKCYYNMFINCTNITTVPETLLPATTLSDECYEGMFYNCSKLTTAPTLPATTLAKDCYVSMFSGCTKLNSVTCLATDISADGCTDYWLHGVAPTGTFNKAASMNNWPTGPYNGINVNGIPVGWTVVNEGAIQGVFTVNAGGGKVNFSMGNLQYQANSTGVTEAPYTGIWHFAAHQYDTIGSNNAHISNSYCGWIDLFGWGTGDDPTKATQNNSDYSTFTDWGVNAISNGGNTANLWRSLTKDEWVYLFNNHTKGWTTVNGVGGYVIRPDGVSTAVASSYTASEWDTEANAGSVFLPAACSRGGTTFNAGVGGDYWSSTPYNSDDAYYLYFHSGGQNPANSACRWGGRAVRLVKNITGQGSLSYATTAVNKMTTEPAFTNPLTKEGDGTVSYAVSSGNNICTVNASTGEVTLNGNTGTCTITATVANSFYTYETTTASYTLTVKTPEQTPLTFEAKVAGATVTFTSTMATVPAIEYSTDGTTWHSYTTGITLTNVGEKVSFRGNNNSYATSYTGTSNEYSKFNCSNNCYVYGNVMSLIDKENFATKKDLPNVTFTFNKLFYQNSYIYNHPYKEIVLPAETLRANCYREMFYGCTHLTKAPALPATTLAGTCYMSMFQGCTSLTTAPVLPAPTLAYMCYWYMFKDCTNLNSVTCLATDISATSCTGDWLSGVASSGTFTKAASMNSWKTGSASGIPSGWTVTEQ